MWNLNEEHIFCKFELWSVDLKTYRDKSSQKNKLLKEKTLGRLFWYFIQKKYSTRYWVDKPISERTLIRNDSLQFQFVTERELILS